MRPRTADYPAALEGLTLEPLTVGASEDGIEMCLGRHPSGIAPCSEAAAAGRSVKGRWLEGLALPDGFFGVAARRDDRVVGILEVYPRRIATQAGFVTGTWGRGEEVLTLTCLEVAHGEARQPVMEFMLEGLLRELPERAPGYEHVEAFGVYGNLAGFNPYWLFEKYGFTRREERQPGVSVILSHPVRA